MSPSQSKAEQLLSDRCAQLEVRVHRLEQQLSKSWEVLDRSADELALLRIVASYAPLVDAGRAEEVAALWADGGGYDVDTGMLPHPEAIAEMVRGEQHQGLISRGSAHLPGLPHVDLNYPESGPACAVVTGHTLLVVRTSEGGYRVLRATANRWEFERLGGVEEPGRGWRVTQRTARQLTDDGAGRALLGALRPTVPPTS